MSTAEVSQLSLREKLQLMETIWQDLRSHVDTLEIPPAHQEILDQRQARLSTGEARLLDWDEVKHTIGRT